MEAVEQAVPMGADPGEILEWRCEVLLNSLTDLSRAASLALELAEELNDATGGGDTRIVRIRGMLAMALANFPTVEPLTPRHQVRHPWPPSS